MQNTTAAFLMNIKTNQLRLILIASALAIGVISAAAVPLLDQQQAKAEF